MATMVRRTAADDAFNPAEFERLFKTAAKIGHSNLPEKVKHFAIEAAFFLYVMGRLGPRLGTVLHFSEENVERDSSGEIVGLHIPEKDPCQCDYCQDLAEKRAENADDADATWEDYIDEYWSPKTPAGGRTIPVLRERGKEIIDLYIRECGEVDCSHETVRRRLTRLAELTNGIDPERITPQSCRASTATYWISLPKFNADDLQLLMGWKHLHTAYYYLGCTQSRLRTAMQEGLGLDPTPAFDVDPLPPTFSELRPDDEDELIQIESVTPDYSPSRHAAPDVLHPLEDEAQERVTEYQPGPMDGIKAISPTALPATISGLVGGLFDKRLTKELSTWVPETGELPSRTRAAKGAVALPALLVMMGVMFAANGVYADPTAPFGIHFPSTIEAAGFLGGCVVSTTNTLALDYRQRNGGLPHISRQRISDMSKRAGRAALKWVGIR